MSGLSQRFAENSKQLYQRDNLSESSHKSYSINTHEIPEESLRLDKRVFLNKDSLCFPFEGQYSFDLFSRQKLHFSFVMFSVEKKCLWFLKSPLLG